MKNLIDGIFLETYSVFIPHSSTLTDVVSLFQHNAVPYSQKNGYLSVESQLFDSGYSFLVFWGFQGEKIQKLTVCYTLEEAAIQSAYATVQNNLKRLLGTPQNPIGNVLSCINPNYKKSIWKLEHKEITHRLWEQFGLRGEISIRLPKSEMRLPLPNDFTYATSEIYLGIQGVFTTQDKKYEISLYCSVRDGVGWQLKCKAPYRIHFDYTDGVTIINDPHTYDYTQLLSQLNSIRKMAHSKDYTEAYRQLEEITLSFIQVYF